jgi:hypothetical protein
VIACSPVMPWVLAPGGVLSFQPPLSRRPGSRHNRPFKAEGADVDDDFDRDRCLGLLGNRSLRSAARYLKIEFSAQAKLLRCLLK